MNKMKATCGPATSCDIIFTNIEAGYVSKGQGYHASYPGLEHSCKASAISIGVSCCRCFLKPGYL